MFDGIRNWPRRISVLVAEGKAAITDEAEEAYVGNVHRLFGAVIRA